MQEQIQITSFHCPQTPHSPLITREPLPGNPFYVSSQRILFLIYRKREFNDCHRNIKCLTLDVAWNVSGPNHRDSLVREFLSSILSYQSVSLSSPFGSKYAHEYGDDTVGTLFWPIRVAGSRAILSILSRTTRAPCTALSLNLETIRVLWN